MLTDGLTQKQGEGAGEGVQVQDVSQMLLAAVKRGDAEHQRCRGRHGDRRRRRRGGRAQLIDRYAGGGGPGFRTAPAGVRGSRSSRSPPRRTVGPPGRSERR